jgi:xylulose-5-phosphate/fructose-6-phosphate phosphoketolase
MIPKRSLVSNLSSYGVARSTIEGAPLSDEEARKTHAFWRACNYLALGMIYLQDNALPACLGIGALARPSPLYIHT